jgi:hypothetical protein
MSRWAPELHSGIGSEKLESFSKSTSLSFLFDSDTGLDAMPHQQSRSALNRRRLSSRVPTGMILFLAVTVGCDSDDGLNRQAISGTVTLDGQPLSGGSILFEPTTNESGTAVGATIRQGVFAISRSQGPVPGPYRVRIYASSATQAPPTVRQTERTPRPMVERLPPRYNSRTELSSVIIAERTNHHRFDLSSSSSLGAQ